MADKQLQSSFRVANTATGSVELRLQPGERIGPYIILEFLGAGGMGRVYLVEDALSLERCVLKQVDGERLHLSAALEHEFAQGGMLGARTLSSDPTWRFVNVRRAAGLEPATSVGADRGPHEEAVPGATAEEDA